jgi:hypothetical protein
MIKENFSPKKFAKIAGNCDYNIGPKVRKQVFRQHVRTLTKKQSANIDSDATRTLRKLFYNTDPWTTSELRKSSKVLEMLVSPLLAKYTRRILLGLKKDQ